ncbi:MAG: prephenate dehydrogenase [Chloroflexi bacterium]|nr:prephenate dehydrogenase [Chloroflexota bacterium]
MDEPGFSLRNATVAIVGLGLMGGSLALALLSKNACAKIIGIDSNEATRTQALACNVVEEASDDLSAAARADVIVIATPARTIIDLLPRVGTIARENAIIIDLGSTKREITQAMEALPAHVQPIGGHPMCGKESSGFAAADANLFHSATFALTPLARTSAATLAFAQSFAETIGARPLVIDAERHDQIVAATSHLPYVVASALMATADKISQDEELLFRLAASGFRDTSRLAASDPTMMIDILLTNRVNVIKMLQQYAAQLNELTDLIDRADAAELRAHLRTIAESRQKSVGTPSPVISSGATRSVSDHD